jgi:restriction system protein
MLDKKISETKSQLANYKLNNWLVSKKDLYLLPPWRFEEWCSRFLQKMGYSDMQIFSNRSEGEKNIVCKHGCSPVYVECFQTYVEEGKIDRDNYYGKVGRPAIQKLVGTMFHDSVKSGVVMTTGYFSKEAEDYVKTLPEDYEVMLINGDMLSMKHWEFIHNEI